MPHQTRIIFIGGFLGAGKTTAIDQIAAMLTSQGKKVSIVTNDQTDQLVDTAFLSSRGFAVREVAGSCFCCNFSGLSDVIIDLIENESPDVILAEPVGSCTDIIATVIKPARALLNRQLNPAPLSVLLDPARWSEVMSTDNEDVWPMRFLLEKQLEEADIIAINKMDLYNSERIAAFQDEVAHRFPSSQLVMVSAKTGEGIADWVSNLDSGASSEQWIQELDYEQYAQAEAEMGWLNAYASLIFTEPKDGKTVAQDITRQLLEGVRSHDGHIGNLKLMLTGQNTALKVGSSQIETEPQIDGSARQPERRYQLTINIRAMLDPKQLTENVNRMLQDICVQWNANISLFYLNAFRPAPPNPTYRYNY